MNKELDETRVAALDLACRTAFEEDTAEAIAARAEILRKFLAGE